MTRATTWLFTASAAWTGLGLLAGLYYRELTRSTGSPSGTQLAVTHTHFLVLGTIFGLVFLLLENQFQLSQSKLFKGFFWTWIAGVAITVGSQMFKGTLQVQGNTGSDSSAIAGISGMGHISLTVAFVLFFFALRSRLEAINSTQPHEELVHQAS